MKGVKTISEIGFLRRVELILDGNSTWERIQPITRGVAQGNPYIVDISDMEVMGRVCKMLVVDVYRDELSFTLANIMRNKSLEYYSRNLPDIVN